MNFTSNKKNNNQAWSSLTRTLIFMCGIVYVGGGLVVRVLPSGLHDMLLMNKYSLKEKSCIKSAMALKCLQQVSPAKYSYYSVLFWFSLTWFAALLGAEQSSSLKMNRCYMQIALDELSKHCTTVEVGSCWITCQFLCDRFHRRGLLPHTNVTVLLDAYLSQCSWENSQKLSWNSLQQYCALFIPC